MTPIEDNTISPHEIEAGDLLWKYIAELHRANGAEQVNFIARTSLDPAEMAALMPLADVLHADFQQHPDNAAGEVMARARLLAAIQSGARPGAPWLLQTLSTHLRDILLLAGLIFSLAGAIWFVYVQTRPPVYVMPAYNYNNTPHPSDCEVPAKSLSPASLSRKKIRAGTK